MNRSQLLELLARLPARFWLQAALGLVGFVVLAVLGFAVIAVKTSTGLVVDDSYAASQSFAGTPTAAWPVNNWWTAYNDPQLNALMDEAFRGAPDLAAAAARLRSAQAYAVQAGAAVIKGKEAQDFKNSKGVHIVFKGTEKGLSFSVGPEGFTVRMEMAE